MKIRIISGIYKGRFITAPRSLKTRPTSSKVRESFFNIIQNAISDSTFLDLFAGSGAMGLEALSRGAKRVSFVEQDKDALTSIKSNIQALKVENKTTVYPKDAFRSLKYFLQKEEKFDIIYCDPPYKLSLDLVNALLIEAKALLNEGGRLFLEFGQKIESFPIELISMRKLSATYLYEF